jgi:hypothetical protein
MFLVERTDGCKYRCKDCEYCANPWKEEGGGQSENVQFWRTTNNSVVGGLKTKIGPTFLNMEDVSKGLG